MLFQDKHFVFQLLYETKDIRINACATKLMRPDVTQNPTGYKLGATNLNVAPIPLNLAQFTTIPLNPQQNDSQQRKCFSISPVGPHNEYGAPLTSQQHTTKLGPLRLASSPKLKLGYSPRASHLQKMHLQRKSVEAKCHRKTGQYRESCISQD